MKGLSKGTELLEFYKDPADSSWWYCQLAVGGVKCVGFSVPTSNILLLQKQGEESLAQYLEAQATTMIERYGDARDPKPDPALLSEKVA